MAKQPEPWLRGPIPGVHALLAPVLFSFEQAREDLAECLDGLTPEQIWATPHGFGSAGFHVKHIAGSTDRLMTYLRGESLTEQQFAFLEAEKSPEGMGGAALLQLLDTSFQKAEAAIRALDPGALAEPRGVGRQKLPTTVAGLLTHIAEHTQRHVGQAVSASKWARTL